MRNELITLAIIVIFVALMGVYVWTAPRPSELAYVPIEVETGAIEVADQPELGQVTLDVVDVSDGAFVTIHESLTAAGGGAPAAIIGVSEYLAPGQHEGVSILLSQEMLPGYPYIALLHKDNGDRVYVTDDDLPAMVDGVVVRPSFTASPPTDTEQEESADGQALEQ